MTDHTPAKRELAPRVTVVIATYDRPFNLSLAIESVLGQTVPCHEILVVGDHCKAETAEVLAGIAEPRLRYVNLPHRCGEQSTPNSVGMALATGDVIAFLNHDDLWLPDHLETSLAALADPSVDLVTTAAGIALTDRKSGMPMVAEISARHRTLRDAFFHPNFWFEPISTWVVRRQTALMIGPFSPAATLYRMSPQNWLLRAWRAGISYRDLPTVTVLKDCTLPRHSGVPSYAEDRFGLADFTDLVLSSSAETSRQAVAESHRAATAAAVPPRAADPEVREALAALCEAEADAYLRDGVDAFDALLRAKGFAPGWRMARLLQSRTGEHLAVPPPLEDIVRFAKDALNDR